jgi:hypothetical protein
MLAHRVFYPRFVVSVIQPRGGGSEKANRFSSPSGDADALVLLGVAHTTAWLLGEMAPL